MTDYSELKSAAEASIKAWDQHFQADSHEFYEAWCAAEETFSMAAREEVVLAMIAENESLKSQLAECAEFIDNAPGDYAEIEALRKDSERLNWLDGRVKPVIENQNWGQPEGELVGYDWGVFGQCSSVREAIDDAMSKEPSNG